MGQCKYYFQVELRWLVGLRLIQLKQQKTLFLQKKLKPILCRVIKVT